MKLLKPRYLTNALIRRHTSDYASLYGAISDVSVTLHKPYSDVFLIMDYIDGPTVQEYVADALQARSLSRPLSPSELDLCRRVLEGVCTALERCERERTPHGDLGPSNMIIDAVHPDRCRLIDFGLNYLLLERVGAMTDVLQLQVYSAPETLEGKQASVAADLYALGHLCLFMCSGGALTTENATYMHDRLWEKHPFVAGLVDDLISRKASVRERFERAKKKKTGSVYADLRVRLQQDFLKEAAVASVHSTRPRVRSVVVSAVVSPLLTVWSLGAQWKALQGEFIEKSRIRYLWAWAPSWPTWWFSGGIVL